jgi:hypothetical protein
MKNKIKQFLLEKHRFFNGKVVAMTVACVAVLGSGAYLLLSKSSSDILRRGSAVAIESFEDIFLPQASEEIVSEVAVSSSSFASDGKISQGTSSLAREGMGNPASADNSYARQKAKEKSSTAESAKAIGEINSAASTSGPSTLRTVSAGNILPISAAVSETKNDDSPATPSSSIDCSFPSSVLADISRRIILNEIAWMGSPSSTGLTADQGANGEWMELANISGAEVSLDGWRILDAAGKIKISFGSGDMLAPDGFYLLSRGGNSVHGISTDKAYAGTLPNTGDELAVLDPSCGVSDFLDASAKWPAGSNTTKQTMERKADLTWQTSSLAGGTPRAENSPGVWVAPVTNGPAAKYEVTVSVAGNGGGEIKGMPDGAICVTACTNEYAAGTLVTLSASPGASADFGGWFGGCSGTAKCSFTVQGPVSIQAYFRLNVAQTLAVNNNETNTPDASSVTNATDTADASDTSDIADTTDTTTMAVAGQTSSSSPAAEVGHLVIAAVQIAGAATDDDLVKIYNPTQGAVDMGGWKLRKKSSTGTDSSLREFPDGSAVAAGGYFTWASSADGFAASIAADASSTGTLAANNSVALFDGIGAQIDAVAWGTGIDQYMEGAAYSDNPLAGQLLSRKFTNGVVVDTDNNAADFTL